jgi:mannitol/fructose-specific phosphotransferase system IIA component (Ntr-type)
MNASNIAHVKRALSLFTLAETEQIAKKVQNLSTEAEVITYLKAEVAKREQKPPATTTK